jgi:hypothetical protein
MKKSVVLLLLVTMLQICGMFFVTKTVQAAGTARWSDATTISYENRSFKDSTNDNTYIFTAVDDSDGCADTIDDFTPMSTSNTTNSTPDQKVTLHVREGSNGNCREVRRDPDITLSNTQATATTRQESCENSAEETGWIVCPLLRQADKAIGQLDKAIIGLLQVPNGYLENPNLKATWRVIRNLAYLIIVPIVLVMVIATALGFDFISAYTVKKSFSRLLIAVMFITLSFGLTTFMVRFFNDVGTGTLGLITSPFGVNDISLAGLFRSSGGTDGLALFSGVLLVGGIVSVTSIGIVGSYALVTFIGVLTGFILLALRQMLLIAMILLAPLAILAWVFPGNDKLWKLWWGAFSKLLMLFPLVMILIGTGRVFASIVQDTAASTNAGLISADNGLVVTMIKLIAYVGPYFFIPAAFKFAGGVFATIAGVANDRHRGVFDRQRKYRAEKRKEIRHHAGMGHRFNPNRTGFAGKVGRAFNKPAQWYADPYSSARVAMGTQGGKSLLAELTQKGALQSQDLAKWMSQSGLNQEALTEIMQNVQRNHGHFNVRELNDAANNWLTGTDDKGNPYNTQYRAAAAQLLNSGQFLNDLTHNEDFARANIGMAAGLAKASQGFINNTGNIAEVAEYSNFLNGLAPGLGDTFKTQAGLMSGQGGGVAKVGYSEQAVYNPNTGRVEYVSGGPAAASTQLMREGPRTFMSSKASALKGRFFNEDDGKIGIARNLLRMDVPPGQEVKFSDGVDEAKVTFESQQAIVDNLVQAAYGYDTPAETASLLRNQLANFKQDTAISQQLRGYIDQKERLATRDFSDMPAAERARLEQEARRAAEDK